MATKKTKVVVNSNGRNIDHTVEAATNGKAPVRIKVQKGAKYLLKGDDGFAPENVTLTRVGNDLQITLEGETSPGLVLEGYYAQSEPVGLYGVAEDGQLYAYARTDGAGDIYALAEGQSAPVALGGDSYGAGAPYLAGTEAAAGNDFFGGMLPLLMTGGLAALGLGAIAAASGSDGDTAPSLPPVMPPPDVRPPGKPGFDGNWTYTPATPLADGGHSISAIVINKAGVSSVPSAAFGFTVDKAGNTSVASDAFGFTVDTVAPTQTATLSAMGKDSGASGADYLTNDGGAGRLLQGTLSAALGKGETLQVSTDGGATWKAAFVSGSKWSAQDDSSHAGNWTVQTRVVDEAGNVGTLKSQVVAMDVTAPAAPTALSVTRSPSIWRWSSSSTRSACCRFRGCGRCSTPCAARAGSGATNSSAR